jgi:hypothetical protein
VWHATALPLTAAVAVFSGPGCVGSATFQGVQMRGQYPTSVNCDLLNSVGVYSPLGMFSCSYAMTYGSATPQTQWRLYEASGCDSSARVYGSTIGINGDLSCYNLPIGSVVVDCTSTGAGKVGTAITSPPMHASALVLLTAARPTPTPSSTYAFAYWTDSSCLAGSALVTAAAAARCWSTSTTDGAPYSAYSIACASNAANSACTIRWWSTGSRSSSDSACQAATTTPTATFTGTGQLC